MKDRRRLRIKQQMKALNIMHRTNCFLTVIIRDEDKCFSSLEIIHKDDFDYYKDKYGDKMEVMF